MINKIIDIIDEPERDCVYSIIGKINLEFCVDIGAAAGHVTHKLCTIGGNHTKVVAYEPFKSNRKYFKRSTEKFSNSIRLINKAMSHQSGTAEFYVGSVVTSEVPGWPSYFGYSAVGYLTSASEANISLINSKKSKYLQYDAYIKPRLRGIFGSYIKTAYPKIFSVKTTTIDSEFPSQSVDLIKIDVQGAEADVLLGAKKMLEEKRVNFLYVEWSGEKEIVDILIGHGYIIYDSVYVIIPKDNNITPFLNIGFKFIKEIKLSTGVTAYEMLFNNATYSPLQAITEVKDKGLGWIHTDLIVVNPEKLNDFLDAKDQYIDEQKKNIQKIS